MSKKTLFLCMTTFLLSSTLCLAEPTTYTLDDYRNGLSAQWKEKSFQGTTQYEIVKGPEGQVIAATSSQSASGLHFDIEYNPQEYPILSWSWKIDKIISAGDARTKDGDDYAARIYVIFPSLLFWKTKALNYVWANKLEKEQFIPNAFTKNAMMIAVESGSKKSGQWVIEKRNIVEDYRRAFGNDPPMVGSIAIMTDTDNTGASASAWYGAISFSGEHDNTVKR